MQYKVNRKHPGSHVCLSHRQTRSIQTQRTQTRDLCLVNAAACSGVKHPPSLSSVSFYLPYVSVVGLVEMFVGAYTDTILSVEHTSP